MLSDEPFGPALDSFPSELSPHPLMVMQLMNVNLAAGSSMGGMGNKILDDQVELGPGDWAFPYMGQSAVEDDAAVVQLVNPLDLQHTYPDWSERYMRNWVLCRWTSHNDHNYTDEIDWQYGWFERSRLMPLTEDESGLMITAIIASSEHREGQMELPDFLKERYDKRIRTQVLPNNPETVSNRVECPSCGECEVEIHGKSTVRMAEYAVTKEMNGKTVFTSEVERPHVDKQIEMHLHCTSCGATRDLESEEYHIGPAAN